MNLSRLPFVDAVVSPSATVEFPVHFSKRLANYGFAIAAFLREVKPVSLLTEMPGNVGDELIHLGTRSFLESAAIAYAPISVSEINCSYHSAVGGTLVVPGSGALTREYHEWLPSLVLKAADLFDRVVIMPSEYETEVPVVKEALGRRNVFALAREAESYGRIKYFGRSGLAMDPALYAFDSKQACETKSKQDESKFNGESNVELLALRTDRCSRLSDVGLQPAKNNIDLSSTASSLSSFLESINSVDAVVSDRLHIVVSAVLLGKKVRYIDPRNEKISRYVRFTFGNTFSNQIEQRDLAWLRAEGYAVVKLGSS